MNYIKDLAKIDEKIKIQFTGGSPEIIEVVSFDDLFNSRLSKGMRITSPSGITLMIRYGDTRIFSINLAEFYPCCGKVLGKGLLARDILIDNTSVPKERLAAIFRIFMDMVENISKYCTYTSFTFIVSSVEQPLFNKLIKGLKDYRVINEFKNERMKDKNLCIEYCKNFSGFEK